MASSGSPSRGTPPPAGEIRDTGVQAARPGTPVTGRNGIEEEVVMNRRWAAVVPALALTIAACGPGGTTSSPPAATASGPAASASGPAATASGPAVAEKCTGQELSFQLSFIPNVQHA